MQPRGVVGKRLHLADQVTTMASFLFVQCHEAFILDIIFGVDINSSMPDYVISKVVSGLNKHKKSINGSKVLVLGLANKKNIDDPRESPSAMLMEKLRDLGAEVAYSDPHIPKFPKMREHKFNLTSVTVTAESLASYDYVLLATDHDSFDYELIKEYVKIIIDTRGRYLNPSRHIIKA